MNFKGAVLTREELEANNETGYVYDKSMVNGELLQNYLYVLFGKQKSQHFSDIDIEKAFIDGLHQKIKNNTHFKANHKIKDTLPNGWIIKTTIDVLNINGETLSIDTNKLSYKYTEEQSAKNITKSRYAQEAFFDEYLLRKVSSGKTVDRNTILFYIKDMKNTENLPLIRSHDLPAPDGSYEKNLIDKTNTLQKYIESGEIPDRCDELWEKDINGTLIPTKCSHYCEQGMAGNCPYYNHKTKTLKNTLD